MKIRRLGFVIFFLLMITVIAFGSKTHQLLIHNANENLTFKKDSNVSTNSNAISWFSHDNLTQPLTNFSAFLLGPHAKVDIVLPQIADNMNVTIAKGIKQGQTRTGSMITDPRKRNNVSIDVVEGDEYNMTLTWDKPTWDLDFRFFDNNSKLIPNLGCTNPDKLLQYGGICSNAYPEVITNFIPTFSGKLTIELSIISFSGTEYGFTNYLFNASNYQEYSIKYQNIDTVTIDTAMVNSKPIWNGDLTIITSVKYGTVYSSSVLFVSTMNWFSPIISSLRFNNKASLCNSLSRNTNMLDWQVSDVNVPIDEKLTFYMDLIKPGQKNFNNYIIITNSTDKLNFNTTNSSDFPSGNYTLKFTVSDSRMNSSKIIDFFVDMNANDDVDNDTIKSIKECQIDMNPFINDFFDDYDHDGIPNGWEAQHDLNVTFADSSADPDNDTMNNYYEYLMGFDPHNQADGSLDSDHDGIPNAIEAHFGLNATDPTDNMTDWDNDKIPIYYEIQYGLNPLLNDSFYDYDNDGLTNLQEYYAGSNPFKADTDGDGLPDGIEVQAGLSPATNKTDGITLDSVADADHDGMPNLWEYLHHLNITDPVDAELDYDGDGVSNLQEFLGGSDPNNFFSVPLFSISYIHIGLSMILLLAVSIFFGFRKYDNVSKEKLMEEMGVKIYQLAKEIKVAGYSNYTEYIADVDIAKSYLEDGLKLFYQENYTESIMLNERAYEIFKKNNLFELVAESILNIIRAQKELHLLSKESLTLTLFPKPHKTTLTIQENLQSVKCLIDGIVEENDGNLGIAEEYFIQALVNKNVDIRFQLICMGGLIELEFRKIMTDPFTTFKEEFMEKINKWQNLSEKSKDSESICHVYLFRSAIELFQRNIDESKQWIDKCIIVSENEGLKMYQKIAKARKEKILVQIRPPSQSFDQKEMMEYIRNAINIIDEKKD